MSPVRVAVINIFKTQFLHTRNTLVFNDGVASPAARAAATGTGVWQLPACALEPLDALANATQQSLIFLLKIRKIKHAAEALIEPEGGGPHAALHQCCKGTRV